MVGTCAAGNLSADNIRQFVNLVPLRIGIAKNINQVACFLARLLAGVGSDDVAAANGIGVEFTLLRKIGADGGGLRLRDSSPSWR